MPNWDDPDDIYVGRIAPDDASTDDVPLCICPCDCMSETGLDQHSICFSCTDGNHGMPHKGASGEFWPPLDVQIELVESYLNQLKNLKPEDRVLIVMNGCVLPGQEERWKAYLTREAETLKAITARMLSEETDPEVIEMLQESLSRTQADWEAEAADSAIAASYRLGVGTISVPR